MDEILRRDTKLREQLEKKNQAMRSESVLDARPSASHKAASVTSTTDSAPVNTWLQSASTTLREVRDRHTKPRHSQHEYSPDRSSVKVCTTNP